MHAKDCDENGGREYKSCQSECTILLPNAHQRLLASQSRRRRSREFCKKRNRIGTLNKPIDTAVDYLKKISLLHKKEI